MEAAALFGEGVKPPEAARRLRVSCKSTYRWHQVWKQGGAAALGSRGPRGQRCKLSVRCQEKLAAYLDQGPAAHSWGEGQVWTGTRVATLIGRKFRVSYSASGATRLMRRLGFTPQVPALRAAERDEQAVAAWKETTWAEVKAPGQPATDGSASRTKPDSFAGRRRGAPGDGAASPRLWRSVAGAPAGLGRRAARDAP